VTVVCSQFFDRLVNIHEGGLDACDKSSARLR
jgi:hypothetical protein